MIFDAAAPALPDLGEGAPWWATLLGGVIALAAAVAPFVLPRLFGGTSTGNPEAEAPQPEGTSVTPTPTPTPPPSPTALAAPPTVPPPMAMPAQDDPEVALIREWVGDLRADLQATRAELARVTARLEDRERMIARLEATIDALTGGQRWPQPPPPPGTMPPRHG